MHPSKNWRRSLKVSCDFNCLEVTIFRQVKNFYESSGVKSIIKSYNIKKLFPSPIVLDINSLNEDDSNLICMYIPILHYLENQYSLLWTSIVIWDLLIGTGTYYFRTIKTNKVTNKRFREIHEFADTDYYKNIILSLTDLLFGKETNISKPLVLHKKSISEQNDLLSVDISIISNSILKKMDDCNNNFNIQERIELLSQDVELQENIKTLHLPKELSSMVDDSVRFLKYLIWLHMLDKEWNYYYYIPAAISLLPRGTGGQTIAVKSELKSRDIQKVMIVNNIIHEPISRFLNEELNNREIRQRQFEIYDYPHTIGSYVLSTLNEAITESIHNGSIDREMEQLLNGCINYLSRKAQYLQLIGAPSDELKPKKEVRTITQIIDDFIKSFAFSSLKSYKIREGKKKWEKLFNDITHSNGSGICVPSIYTGVIENILEHLVLNSILKGKADKIYLNIAKISKDTFELKYYDNGVGVDEETLNKLERWDRFGPNKDEGKRGFGIRTIYRAAVELGNGKKSREPFKLPNGNYRMVDIFQFPVQKKM